MSSRPLLRLLAAFFLVIGVFLLLGAKADPAPREIWQTYRGELLSMEFTDTPKVGRQVVVTIGNEEPRFALNHLRSFAGLEARLTGLKTGTELAIDAVPRERSGWAAPEGQPLTLLVLRNGDEVIYDRDRDATDGPWVTVLVTGFGGLAIVLAVSLWVVTWRRSSGREV